MTLQVNLDEKLIFSGLQVENANEVLEILSRRLWEEGYVKEAYIEAIKEREGEYPTGLPSTMPAIAIPHANNELVNKTTIAIATLKEPVNFKNMENTSEDVPIQIVIMLAIAEPHGQIEMLQKIVTIIQDESLRHELVATTEVKDILSLIKERVL